MSTPLNPDSGTSSELDALVLQFREVKHSINNSIGVIMAMSELAQLNPDNVGKLIKTVLDRAPKIVDQLHQFGTQLQQVNDRLNP